MKDTLQTIYTSEHNVMRRSYSDLVGHKSFYFPKVTLIPAATSVEEDTGDLNTNFKRKSTALVQTGRTERGFNFTAIWPQLDYTTMRVPNRVFRNAGFVLVQCIWRSRFGILRLNGGEIRDWKYHKSSFKPPGGIIYFKPIWGRCLIETGGLFNWEKKMVSVLHKDLEYKVEKLKYKKVGGLAAVDQNQIGASNW